MSGVGTDIIVGRRRWRRGPVHCRELGKVLQAHLDGHLDAGYAALVEQHLELCRRCGLEAETYERIKAVLRRHEPLLPEDALVRLRTFGAELLDERRE